MSITSQRTGASLSKVDSLVAEKLTKTAIKKELQRRIDWYEKSYPKIKDLDRWNYKGESELMIEACGSYWAYRNILTQVHHGLFLNGGL